jgi:hypothetical protein
MLLGFPEGGAGSYTTAGNRQIGQHLAVDVDLRLLQAKAAMNLL